MPFKTDPFILNLPPVIFGTSGLGNLFVALNDEIKLEIIKECFLNTDGRVIFDSAGKYGAGLALESLGKCLKELKIAPDDVVISNKLAWLRTELKTPEPTFEPGIWRNLKHDAIQSISYDGIMECFKQGNELLNGYVPQMVSVHDADEYLKGAKTPDDEEMLYQNVLEAYRALTALKKQGRVKAIGIGAKDWNTIKRISDDVDLDWVMIANSMTIHSHPLQLLEFMKNLEKRGIQIINSAVFNAGYLTGGDYYNYRFIDDNLSDNANLSKWRKDFFNVCARYDIKPAQACVQFGLMAPGVKSVALNTSDPKRVKHNIDMAKIPLTKTFWNEMIDQGLIDDKYFNYLSSTNEKILSGS